MSHSFQNLFVSVTVQTKCKLWFSPIFSAFRWYSESLSWHLLYQTFKGFSYSCGTNKVHIWSINHPLFHNMQLD